jgi:hypothetical protein
MAPIVTPLDQFASVVLDGSGDGYAEMGPTRVKEHWQPISVFVSVATAVNQAIATLYVGTSIQNSTQSATTALGSSGDTCGTPGLDLPAGYKMFVKWTGGDAGQQATMHALGTITFGYGS